MADFMVLLSIGGHDILQHKNTSTKEKSMLMIERLTQETDTDGGKTDRNSNWKKKKKKKNIPKAYRAYSIQQVYVVRIFCFYFISLVFLVGETVELCNTELNGMHFDSVYVYH